MKRYLHHKLTIWQLRAVAAIASHGSLSGASALGVSQPALTKTLREMEDILGVRIFERHARGAGRSRPLCDYPKWLRYNGSGDVNQASSFTCVN